MAHGFEPHVGLSADSVEPALDSLSPSLSTPPPLAQVLSLSLSTQMLSDDGCFFSQGTQLKAVQSSQWGKR